MQIHEAPHNTARSLSMQQCLAQCSRNLEVHQEVEERLTNGMEKDEFEIINAVNTNNHELIAALRPSFLHM